MSHLKTVNASQGYIHKYENLKGNCSESCVRFYTFTIVQFLINCGKQLVMLGVDYWGGQTYTSHSDTWGQN
jgi:hypothetical protein